MIINFINPLAKSATILCDGSERSPTFRMTTEVANQSVWVDQIVVRPRWVEYATNVWSIGYDVTATGAIQFVTFDGVITTEAADQDNVTSSAKWYDRTIGARNHIIYVYSTSNPESSGEDIIVVTTTNTYSVQCLLRGKTTSSETTTLCCSV